MSGGYQAGWTPQGISFLKTMLVRAGRRGLTLSSRIGFFVAVCGTAKGFTLSEGTKSASEV